MISKKNNRRNTFEQDVFKTGKRISAITSKTTEESADVEADSFENDFDSEELSLTDESIQDGIKNLCEQDGGYVELPIGLIDTSGNIRKEIDEQSEEFKSLVESIRHHGILQAPIVTVAKDQTGVFSVRLLGGERRIRAARALGCSTVKCLIRMFKEDVADVAGLSASISENVVRQDMDPIDLGQCYAQMLKKLGMSTKKEALAEMGKLYGKNPKTIELFIKIGRWPQPCLDLVRQNREKFPTNVLLRMASRRMSDDELLEEVMARTQASQKNRKRTTLVDRLNEACTKRAFNEDERKKFMEVLVEIGVLNAPPEAPKTLGNWI